MGGQITYLLSTCFFCGKTISSNGLAQTQHRRKHCRENLIVEIQNDNDGSYSHIVDLDKLEHRFWSISHWQQRNPNEKVLAKYPTLKKYLKIKKF